MVGQAIGEGIIAGLVLSVFVGPIFFTMLQLGVEHGFKAAFALALGQWTSDLIFIGLAFWSIGFVEHLVDNPESRADFIWYSGTFGGLLLVLFGLGLLLTKSVSTSGDAEVEQRLDEIEKKISPKSPLAYLAYFSQGFLINTVNPTPLLFWLSLMGIGVSRNFDSAALAASFTTVMIVVIITDLLKIYLAKTIRNRLKAEHFLKVRRLAGLVLAGFGLSLFIKVNFF